MKNWKWLIAILMIIVLPVIVDARTPDYHVHKVYMDATVDMVGSLHIREAIVVRGELNGFERDITYQDSSLKPWEPGSVDFAGSSFYNARGVTLSKVSAMKIDEEEIGWNLLDKDYEKYEEDEYATVGDNGVYSSRDNDDGIEVRIYEGNDGGYIVYYYDYYIDQAVVLHNDVAELCFGFFRLDADDVDEVNVQVILPFSNPKDNFRFWARGGLDGVIAPIEGSAGEDGTVTYRGVVATLNNYEAGRDFTIRMILDKRGFSVANNILNNSEQDAFDGIVDYERGISESSEGQLLMKKIMYYVTYTIAVVYLIGLIGLWIYMYKKYDKEYKVEFDHKYYREFTGDYGVEVVDYLMNKNISTNAFNASVMNLVYKHNIDFEGIPKNEKDLTLVLKSKEGLSPTESKLAELLFEIIGDGNKVTLKQISKFSSNYKTAEQFMNYYNDWNRLATRDAINENFFEEHTGARGLATLYFVLGIIVFFMIITQIDNLFLAIAAALGALAFLIYVWTFKKWTKKGREHYLKWSAFKNFLLDFGSFKDKEVPEVKLWDRYLVYATVFGITKEVQKAMKIQLSDMNMNEKDMVPSFYYGDFYFMNSLSKSINNAVNTSTNVISEHNMSSSGFGGGFSSGGGFSGGGGGGGGGGF